MGTYNIIGIGGTGSKCVEALVHLCAAGMGPDKLFVLIVDPDKSNGNIEKLKKVINNYKKCHDILGSSGTIFKSEIVFSENNIFSPAESGESLEEYFMYDSLIQDKDKELGDIFNLLYSKSERDLHWDRGFCGRPVIGAPVMTRINDELNQPPWSDAIQNIDNDLGLVNDSRLFIFASIFGASGASGFPVVASALRNHFVDCDNFYIGGSLLTPYFNYDIPSNPEGVVALPKDFFQKTKVALQYYSLMQKELPYNSIYIVGQKEPDKKEDEENRKFATGGPEQNNYAHYIELLAALSSLDFYPKDINANNPLKQYATARTEEKIIGWSDLPSKDLRENIIIFTTLAFSYRVFYYPFLTDDKNNVTKKPYLAPWFVDHFSNNIITNDERINLDSVYNYLKFYLDWLYEINFSTDIDLQLLNKNALKDSKKEGFKKLNDKHIKFLTSSGEHKCRLGYDTIWDELCNIELSPSETVPSSFAGKFLLLLEKASKNFCKKNY